MAYLVGRRLAHVNVGSSLEMLLLNLLAHSASVRRFCERLRASGATELGTVHLPMPKARSKSLRRRSAACVATWTDFRCCAFLSPDGDSAQPWSLDAFPR